MCSTNALVSREEGRVPSVLVLPLLCDGPQRHCPPAASSSQVAVGALGGGGLWGRVASSQLSSARRGPRPSSACGQQARQRFHLDLMAACSCQGSRERTWCWQTCEQRWSLLRFQVPPTIFQMSIKMPICNRPGPQSIPVCSAWQG